MKTVAAFLCLLAVLPAEEPSKDPFVKRAVKPASPAGTPAVTDIGIFVETFTLPQAAYAAWLDAPADRERLHARVVEAVQKGTAMLDGCHFIRTQAGTRCSVEGVEEFIYPSDWSKADHVTGLQYPQRMEMERLGDRAESEPTIDEHGGSMVLNSSFERWRFLGYRAVKTGARHQGAVTAGLAQQKIIAAQHMVPGVPALAGTSTHGTSTTLVFNTLRLIHIDPPAAPVEKGAGNASLTARVFSLDRLRAWELMRQHADKDEALLQDVRALIPPQQAVLEHVSTLSGQTGTSILHESGVQHYYATEYDAPSSGRPAIPAENDKTSAQPAVLPHQAGVTSFDCRPLGFRWETEPTLNYRGKEIASSNLSFSYTKLNGTVKDPAWSDHYPEWPIFQNQQVVTGIQQPVGSTVLVSTLNPPGETGLNARKDEARVWLLFIELTLE